MSYSVQDRIKPRALRGISDDQIRQHWALYEGYVKNVNGLLEDLERAEIGSRSWAELKRRAGFEFNGMALHEYYFGNLAAGSQLSAQSALASDLMGSWGTVEVWRQDFAKTGAMRGVGWAILYRDPMSDRLFNWWIGDHELNHPAGCHPILVLDVFEHAWMVDYGASGRDEYIRAFLDNVCWEVVEQRYKDSRAGAAPVRF